MNNYLQTRNPFALPAPPQWWLTRLHDLDAALVVFPSVLKHSYILARRRSHSLRMPELVALDKNLLKMSAGGDGDILSDHNLVFVESIVGWGIWTDAIFRQLKARDTWAVGGGDKYADKLEAEEQAVADRKRATLIGDIEHRAVDAWHSYQARTGARTRLADATTPPRAKIIQVGTL